MNPAREELACLYVLDRLDAAERVAFEARLLNDPELNAYVRELESAMAHRILALPQHAPGADLLAGIESRIRDLSSAARTPSRTAVLPWASMARWGIAAAIAVSVGTIAVESVRNHSRAAERPYVIVGLDSFGSSPAEVPALERPQGADARFIQLASLAEKVWAKPGTPPTALGYSPAMGRGFAVFDPGSDQGFIGVRHLPAAEVGKCYRLWVLDSASGKVRDAGILPLAGSTGGLYFFSLPAASGGTAGAVNFFVTTEDASTSESTQPSGRVVLGNRSF